MSVTSDIEVKVNRYGSKCPAWCDIDHAHANVHTGGLIDAHISAAMADDLGYPRVALMQGSTERKPDFPPQIHLSALPGFVIVFPEMAGDLANLIQSLAECTPQRLRDLADEIRTAAQIARDTQ